MTSTISNPTEKFYNDVEKTNELFENLTKADTKALGKFQNHKVQQLAHNFFTKRTEASFSPLYNEMVKIINSVAPPIVKFDKDKIATIIGDISMTVWVGTNASNEDIYTEERSFLSWVYVSAKNKAIQHYKKTKTRKELCESDMIRDGKDDEFNSFDHATFGVGYYSEMEIVDEQIENCLFHNCPKAQVKFVEDRLKQMFSGEEYEILHKAMIQQISPKVIAEEYGINSRITVSTRNTRVKQKIAKQLSEAIYSSEMSEDLTKNGSYVKRMNDVEVRCERKDGILHGTYRKFYENGNIKIEGEYRNGKKIGEWKSYYESGVLESTANYSDDAIPFILYDRYGSEESAGCLN